MYTGIDIGYNATKAVTDRRRTTFPSAVGSPDRASFTLNGGNESAIVLLSPSHVLIGEEAVQQSRFLNRREDRRWIDSGEWLALFIAALTGLTSGSPVDVEVVTGLPVSFYSDKEQVQQRLLGEHRVQREGRRGQILRVVNARVIPQPFGSLLAEVLDERGQIQQRDLAQAAVGLIDIGGKTCNLLSVNRLSEIGRETTSVNIGGWNLVRAVRQWLAQHYPGLDDLRDHQLATAIQARTLHYYGEPVKDFPAVVNDLAADLARQILSEASHLWNGGATLDAILVTGGGALLLGEHIRRHWTHARLVSEPVYGNAVGYWKFARRLWGKV
ncbi:MAG: ParM/StbA family protein [Anaerolineae bacterium]|nr:ParM/StbA family protein [Anaerolineae bacterium]